MKAASFISGSNRGSYVYIRVVSDVEPIIEPNLYLAALRSTFDSVVCKSSELERATSKHVIEFWWSLSKRHVSRPVLSGPHV
jgi:hypothetical protein